MRDIDGIEISEENRPDGRWLRTIAYHEPSRRYVKIEAETTREAVRYLLREKLLALVNEDAHA